MLKNQRAEVFSFIPPFFQSLYFSKIKGKRKGEKEKTIYIKGCAVLCYVPSVVSDSLQPYRL